MAKAKIIKRKKRIRIEGVATLFFTLAILIFLGAKYGLMSYNYSLGVEKTKIEKQAVDLKEDVANLQSEVNKLQSRDRVLGVAEKDNIKTNQDNVTVIGKDAE